jgi:type I restriction enzyme S subunit
MNGEIRRFKRYPAYKDSGVEWLGKIPKHWNPVRLRSTVTACQNGVWGDEPDGKNDIPCVRVADFDRTTFRVSEIPTLRSIDKRIVAVRGLKLGDLLLEKSGGGENQPVGVVVFYDRETPAVCSNFIARMIVAEGFDSSFLTYTHAAMYALRINTKSIKQNTGIQNLDGDSYLSESAAFPTIGEQSAIATFLNRETAKIDALVTKKERLIELLKEKRNAIVTRAVTTGLDPNVPMKESGIDWIPRIPGHWKPTTMRRLFRQAKRQGYVDETVLSVYREYGVIEKASRDDNFNRTPEDLNAYQLVTPGDLVINKMKAWQGSLGVSDLRGITSPDYVVFSSLHRENPRFLHYFLRNRALTGMYLAISNGIRPSQWRLEPDRFADVPAFLPPRAEQDAICDYVDRATREVELLIERVDAALHRLSEFRTALISAAVTGKIDIRGEVS